MSYIVYYMCNRFNSSASNGPRKKAVIEKKGSALFLVLQ